MFSFLRRSTPELGVDDLAEALRDGRTAVVDVREEWEFRRGHVAGASNIPLGQLGGRSKTLARNGQIAVICESGSRSLAATDFLLSQGFAGAMSVRGGTNAWARSGRPLEMGATRVA